MALTRIHHTLLPGPTDCHSHARNLADESIVLRRPCILLKHEMPLHAPIYFLDAARMHPGLRDDCFPLRKGLPACPAAV